MPAVRAAAAEALGNLGAALATRARLDGQDGVSRGLAIQLERISSCLQLALAPTIGASLPSLDAHKWNRCVDGNEPTY